MFVASLVVAHDARGVAVEGGFRNAQREPAYWVCLFSGGRSHGRPADVLLRERDATLSALGDETLKRFEGLFQRINDTLSK